MKHIRTTWAEPVYTIEITESERQRLASLLALAGSVGDTNLITFFVNELPATKP